MAEMADMAVFTDGRDGLFSFTTRFLLATLAEMADMTVFRDSSFTNPILLRTQVPIPGQAIWSECWAVFIELYQ